MPHHAVVSLLATSEGVPRGIVGASVAMGLAGGAIILLVLLRPTIRQTTLRSPWGWCLATLASLGIVESWFQLQPAGQIPLWLPAARYMAGALSLCPIVSVLGAKRPQDRAWNLVVLALWGIVSLPAIMWLAMGRGQEFRLNDLRGLILWILIALPAINYFPTRFAAAALLIVIGQGILFGPFLPLLGVQLLKTDPGLVTLACFWTAAFVVLRSQPRVPGPQHRFNMLWRNFRDEFGLFWGLRVQERVNAAAEKYDWPFYLTWSGFRGKEDHLLLREIPEQYRRGVTQIFRQLLRRFATPQWIAIRLPEGID